MSLQVFPDLTSLTHFPYPESNTFEFKETFPHKDSYAKSILNPLCGFLNASGGYLVIGVVDSDRWIKGIPLNKDYDAFLLKIDDIIRLQHIRPDDGTQLLTSNLKTFTAVSKEGKTVVVVKAIPTPGTSYTSLAGKIVRLSASNLRVSTLPKFVSALQYEKNTQELERYRDLYHAQKLKLKYVEESYRTLSNEVEEILGKAKEIEVSLEKEKDFLSRTLKDLERRILKEKEVKEEELEWNTMSFMEKVRFVLGC